MNQYIGKMLDNRYEILDVIGVGGMAVVYKAYCHRLHRFVAIKVLKKDLASDAEFRRRFHEEAQAVAMLSHPNIVSVYDVSKGDDLDYIVMELIDGITLKQYMQKKDGRLNWRESLYFITQIVRALGHAHSRGIIHRDIKPQNIMVLRDGSVTVYPMVALFGRPLEVEAQGIVLSSGADGQGAVNFRYEGMNATVLYSKIANSSLPSEIQGEEGNLLLDAIHTIRDVAYLPRPAAASGRGDAPVRHSVGLPLEKDTYYYEVAEFIDLIEQGRIESTVNSHENSLVTMEIIDQVRRQLGVSYPADRLP